MAKDIRVFICAAVAVMYCASAAQSGKLVTFDPKTIPIPDSYPYRSVIDINDQGTVLVESGISGNDIRKNYVVDLNRTVEIPDAAGSTRFLPRIVYTDGKVGGYYYTASSGKNQCAIFDPSTSSMVRIGPEGYIGFIGVRPNYIGYKTGAAGDNKYQLFENTPTGLVSFASPCHLASDGYGYPFLPLATVRPLTLRANENMGYDWLGFTLNGFDYQTSIPKPPAVWTVEQVRQLLQANNPYGGGTVSQGWPGSPRLPEDGSLSPTGNLTTANTWMFDIIDYGQYFTGYYTVFTVQYGNAIGRTQKAAPKLRWHSDVNQFGFGPLASGYVGGTLFDVKLSGATPATCVNNRGEMGVGGSAKVLVPRDTDKDGIPDDWEFAQGIDVDWDGTNDIVLPGADPNKIDIFVEYDIMAGQDTPSLRSAMRWVEESFRMEGINLHFVDGGHVLPHIPLLNEKQVTVNYALDADFVSYFSLPGEIDHVFGKEVKMAKANVYRYMVVYDKGVEADGDGLLGKARGIPSNSFAVFAEGGSRHAEELAYTIMHELGHTLGLRHGGSDDVIGKPNYASVMNYIYMPMYKPDGWMAVPGWRLDFSGESLNLIESALVESVGNSIRSTKYPGTVMPFATGWNRRIEWASLNGTGIDWSGDGAYQASPVWEDPNFWGANTVISGTSLPSPNQSLVGHDDWTFIKSSRFLSPFVAALEKGSLQGTGAEAPLDCPTLEAGQEMTMRYPVLPSIRWTCSTPGGNMPARTVQVEIKPVPTGNPEVRACTISEIGRLSTPLPATAGTYRLTFIDKGALTKSVSVTVTTGAMLSLDSSVAYGDIDGDNTISLFDYLILSEYFESAETQANWTTPGASGFAPKDADIDRDGVVSLFDYLFLSENFDKTGD